MNFSPLFTNVRLFLQEEYLHSVPKPYIKVKEYSNLYTSTTYAKDSSFYLCSLTPVYHNGYQNRKYYTNIFSSFNIDHSSTLHSLKLKNSKILSRLMFHTYSSFVAKSALNMNDRYVNNNSSWLMKVRSILVIYLVTFIGTQRIRVYAYNAEGRPA